MPSTYQIHGQSSYSWQQPDGLKNLRLLKDVPKPTEIPAGHALVRIRAAALNARDWMVIAHDPIYYGPNAPDLVPCADGAGEIEVAGEGSIWKPGDRVVISSTSWQDWSYRSDKKHIGYDAAKGKGSLSVQGTLREYAVIPDNELIKAPLHLTFEELASLPAAGATAIHALFHGPRSLKPGQTVLAQGTGGVSCFVIQIAAAIGATVIVTSSSDDKLTIAKKLGATHLINYRTHPEWDKEVLALTNGEGVDMVVDVAGSTTIQQSLAATKFGGLVPVVGILSESKPSDIVPALIFGAKTVYGTLMFTVKMLEELCELFEAKKIRPQVGKVFEWEDAAGAFMAMKKGGMVGKVVIKVGY